MENVVLDDEILQKIYAWIDEIPLSRPKKNIGRDFSDGILAAEVIAYYFPKLVQMHNYSSANSVTQKQYNWGTLNTKVLKRLGFQLMKRDIDDIVQCKPGAVEEFLSKLQVKIANYRIRKSSANDPIHETVSSQQDISQHDSTSSDHSVDRHKRSEIRQVETKDEGPGLEDYAASIASYASRASHKSSDPPMSTSSAIHLDLQEKNSIIEEQRETIQILEQKIQKLEQLVRLKDGKIQTLVAKLRTPK